MASITHSKVSGKPAGNDPTKIYGTDWDDEHVLTGTANKILGFDSDGAAFEASRTGDVASDIVTGTSGAEGNIATWDDRGNLVDSGSAPLAVGTEAGTVAAGDDSRFYVSQSGTGSVPQTISDLVTDRIFTPEMFGAAADTIYMKGAVTTTAGDTTVAITGANFTASDVGKIIAIGGCGYCVAAGMTLGAGGSGYGSLPTLTVVGGTAVTATTMYAIGTAGAITKPNQTRQLGLYSAIPSNPVATTSDDSGTGATMNMVWRNLSHRATISQVNSATEIVLSVAPFVSLAGTTQEVIYGTDDTTDVQQAVTAWVAALRAGTPATLRFSRGYTITTTVAASLLEDDAPGVIDGGGLIHVANTANSTKGLYIHGPSDQAGKTTTVSVDATRGDDTITVADGTKLKEGDLLWLTARNSSGADLGMSNRVVAVSGNNITLAYALEFDVTSSFPTNVQVWKPARNITIKDISLYGNGVQGTGVVGLHCVSHDFLTINNVKAYNFNTDVSEGVAVYECLEGDIEARCRKCGAGSVTYAAHTAYTTATRIKLSAVESYSFGLQLLSSSGNRVDLRNRRSAYRGVKFYGSCGNTGTVDHARGNVAVPEEQWTGVSFDGGSSHNDLASVASMHTSYGLWSTGLGETNNIIRSYRYKGNTTDILVGSSTQDFKIYSAEKTAPTITDAGTNTRVERPNVAYDGHYIRYKNSDGNDHIVIGDSSDPANYFRGISNKFMTEDGTLLGVFDQNGLAHYNTGNLRARAGLISSDEYRVQLTPDGSTFYDAIKGIRKMGRFDVALARRFSQFEWQPRAASSTLDQKGVTVTVTGTASATTPGNTSEVAGLTKVGYFSSAAAGSSAGVNAFAAPFWRGNGTNQGGFFVNIRFYIHTAVSGQRVFAGLLGQTTAIGNVDPSSLTQSVGIAVDAGETQFSLMHNDGSGTATKTALSSAFVANTSLTDWYDLSLWSAKQGSEVKYRIEKRNTGDLIEGTLTTDIPDATQMLCPHLWINNGATASTATIGLIGFYGENASPI